MARPDGWVVRYLPALLFLAVYVLTCLLGALLLLADYRPFVDLFEYFTAVPTPRLDEGKLAVALFLLIAPPLALVVGFAAAMRLSAGVRDEPERHPTGHASATVPVIVFAASALLAVVSLVRSGAPANAQAWLSYETWIDARWHNFQTISFAEFVNIYLFLPLSAAWVLVTSQGSSRASFVRRWLPTVVALVLSLLLFQKKAALVVLLIVIATWLLDRTRFDVAGLRTKLVGGVGLMAVLYFAMVVIPTFNAASAIVAASPQRERPALLTPAPTVETSPPPGSTRGAESSGRPTGPSTSARPTAVPAVTQPPSVAQTSPVVGLALYSLLAPLIRTSVPALYYPVVFPELHGWYGLDVGQDVICSPRLGCRNGGMPDDNLVIWDYMNPTFHGGSIAAPFQFALYSQVGPVGALVGALVLGVAVGLGWSLARSGRLAPTWSSMLGALVILLAVYLAIDSPRNSILVSYGVVWGLAFLAFGAGLSWAWARIGPGARRMERGRARVAEMAS